MTAFSRWRRTGMWSGNVSIRSSADHAMPRPTRYSALTDIRRRRSPVLDPPARPHAGIFRRSSTSRQSGDCRHACGPPFGAGRPVPQVRARVGTSASSRRRRRASRWFSWTRARMTEYSTFVLSFSSACSRCRVRNRLDHHPACLTATEGFELLARQGEMTPERFDAAAFQ